MQLLRYHWRFYYVLEFVQMNNVLYIIGPYPPPLGGVSVHIERLLVLLEQNSITYKLYNTSPIQYKGKNKNIVNIRKYYIFNLILILFDKDIQVVHFHQTFKGFEYLYWYLFSITVRNRKILVTLHNDDILYSNRISSKIIIALLNMSHIEKIITVSESVYNNLHPNLDVCYLPAYIPPSDGNGICSSKKRNIIITNIYRVTADSLEKIYGFDITLRLFSNFQNEYMLYILIGDERSDIGLLNAIINKYGISTKNIKIIIGEPLINYLPESRLFLRTTRRDGYGNSIQEALDLGTIAVASNVCKRPDGTILFNINDEKDLLSKVNFILNMDDRTYNKKIETIKEMKKKDNTLLNIYTNLTKE